MARLFNSLFSLNCLSIKLNTNPTISHWILDLSHTSASYIPFNFTSSPRCGMNLLAGCWISYNAKIYINETKILIYIAIVYLMVLKSTKDQKLYEGPLRHCQGGHPFLTPEFQHTSRTFSGHFCIFQGQQLLCQRHEMQ